MLVILWLLTFGKDFLPCITKILQICCPHNIFNIFSMYESASEGIVSVNWLCIFSYS